MARALGSVIRLTLKSVPKSARAAAAKVAASARNKWRSCIYRLAFPHIPFANVALAFSAVNSPVKPAFNAKANLYNPKQCHKETHI